MLNTINQDNAQHMSLPRQQTTRPIKLRCVCCCTNFLSQILQSTNSTRKEVHSAEHVTQNLVCVEYHFSCFSTGNKTITTNMLAYTATIGQYFPNDCIGGRSCSPLASKPWDRVLVQRLGCSYGCSDCCHHCDLLSPSMVGAQSGQP